MGIINLQWNCRRVIVAGVLAVALAVGYAVPARADYYISNLDIISTPSIGSGTLGTVKLTQNGANEVDVHVTLLANTKFVSTGGPHHAFVFNLNLTGYAVTITSPTGGVFTLGGTGQTNTPYGTFTYGINCPGCGPGASHANPGPLDFKVTKASGITIANFTTNSLGYFFSADVTVRPAVPETLPPEPSHTSPSRPAWRCSPPAWSASVLCIGCGKDAKRDEPS